MLIAPKRILPTLVLAQFAGTSLWFAVNAVMPDLQQQMGWPASAVGRLTSALQLGFIVGTLVFALLAIADRFSARRVFLFCALAGALCTLGAMMRIASFTELLLWRAATGFFLAGIYPVGMKIASQWFPKGLGVALGWLVGALVLGSASAHGIRALSVELPWSTVMISVALLAAAGGLLLFMVIPEPPNYSANTKKLEMHALATIWTDWRVRASVLGYFGHMWELYAFWSVLPWLSLPIARSLTGPGERLASSVAWISFAVIGIGFFGCVLGGLWSRRVGSAQVAASALAASGLMCVGYPFIPDSWPLVQLGALLFWGVCVVADSPQFSAMSSQYAPPQWLGSALVLQNGVGFLITVLSILLLGWAVQHWGSMALWLLAPGPALGLWALRPLLKPSTLKESLP